MAKKKVQLFSGKIKTDKEKRQQQKNTPRGEKNLDN